MATFFSLISLANDEIKKPDAQTPPITLHWGINLEPLEYFNIAALRFKQAVEIRTDNKIKVQLTVGKYKQDDRDHLKDVQNGMYDMGQEVISHLVKYEDKFSVWELPFLFESDQHVFDFTKSSFARLALAEFGTKTGVRAIEYTYSGGFIHTFGAKIDSMKPLSQPNKTFYVEAATDNYKNVIKEFLNLEKIELYDQGVLNHSNNSSEIISSVLEELYVTPADQTIYLNTTGHRVYGRVIFINEKFLAKLSPSQQKIVLEEARKAGQFERELSLEASQNYIENFEKNRANIIVNKWNLKQRINERKNFKKVYDQFDKKFGNSLTNQIINIAKH